MNKNKIIFKMLRIIFPLFLILPALVFANNVPKETRILILGDSLTEGYGVSKKEAFPAILEKILQKKNPRTKVINAGSSGSTSAGATSRLKWQLRTKPQLLILALGANDGLRGIKVSSTEKNLADCIELAQSKGVKVILAGMKLPFNYGKEYRDQFETLFKNLVKKYKTGFIPFLLKGVGGRKEFNLADGIHPNPQGHHKVAQTVAIYLKNYLY